MIEHRKPQKYRNRSLSLVKVESEGKQDRFYIDGKRVSEDAFEYAKMWRSQDCFLTQTVNGITRHHSRVYWSESAN